MPPWPAQPMRDFGTVSQPEKHSHFTTAACKPPSNLVVNQIPLRILLQRQNRWMEINSFGGYGQINATPAAVQAERVLPEAGIQTCAITARLFPKMAHSPC